MEGMELPEGWRVARLEEIANLKDGDWILRDDYSIDGVRLLQVGDIGVGEFVGKSSRYISRERALELKCTFLSTGDILISRMADPVGRACLLPDLPYPSITAVDVSICRVDEHKADRNFVVLALNHPQTLFQAERLAYGVTRKRVTRRNLQTVTLPLPPLNEQRAIAQALRTVQEAREARRREAALERERKAALMQYLFTYGTRGEGATTEETKYGRVPAHWKVMPLEKCAYVQTGVAKGRKLGESNVVAVPYLRVANVQDGYLDLSEIKEIEIRESEIERYRLHPGDVVVTEGGDFDKLGRGFIWRGQIPKIVHQNHIFAVRVSRDLLMPEYFAYLIQSDYGKGYFLSVAHKTTNLASINSTKLNAFPTLIPELAEQREIAETLRACDAKTAALDREAAGLEELFRAMLEALMTGRLRVAGLVA